MSERLERQRDQHAINGATEPDSGAAAVRRRRPGVGAELGGSRDRVAGSHRGGGEFRRRPVSDEDVDRRRSAGDGGGGGDRLEIHADD